MKKVVMVAAVMAALAVGGTAFAQEKVAGIFATDVLNMGSGAVTMGYEYYGVEQKEVWTDGVDTERYNFKIAENYGLLRGDLGLGYGFQIGVQQRFLMDGSVEYAYNGVYLGKEDYSGALNPEFELKWNPMQAFAPTSQVQAIIGYRVKPSGMAKDEVMDNYTENTIFAAVSYDAKPYSLRPYLKYELKLNGKEEADMDLGNQNMIVIGTEYKVMDGLKVDAAYTYLRYAGISGYDGGFSVNKMGLSVQYQIPGIPYMDVYVVPYGSVEFNGKREFVAEAGESDRVESTTGYRAGAFVKVVF